MLVDLHECVKPTLSIMDAVWGMEGNGPTAGQNRHIDLLWHQKMHTRLIWRPCYLIDYAPNEVDTVREAIERGLVCDSAEKIDIAGEDIKPLVMKDYLKPESHFNLIKLISLPDALNARTHKRTCVKACNGLRYMRRLRRMCEMLSAESD